LIYGGVTHKFIDVSLVTIRQIHVDDFEGFNVVLADGCKITFIDRIRGLEVALGKYILIYDFYVLYLEYTHVILGFQWLYSLVYIHMNYQDMRMEFQDKGWTTSHTKRYVDKFPQDHV